MKPGDFVDVHLEQGCNEDNKPQSCLECDYSGLPVDGKTKCPCLGNSDYVDCEHRASLCPYDVCSVT